MTTCTQCSVDDPGASGPLVRCSICGRTYVDTAAARAVRAEFRVPEPSKMLVSGDASVVHASGSTPEDPWPLAEGSDGADYE